MTKFRRARASDAFEILRVYQLDHQTPADDVLFARATEVAASVNSLDSIWLVRTENERVEGFAWILIDREQKLCKINRAYTNPALAGGREAGIEDLVKETIEYLRANEPTVEVLYTTMRPLAYRHDLVRELGFKILGIFPNGKDVDASLVNSLAAYYFGDVLSRRRQGEISLHPAIVDLFEIARKECGLSPVPTTALESLPVEDRAIDGSGPELEIITAPLFVSRRFQKLKSRRFLAINFYPFHEPTTLITNPDQTIEVFVKIFPESGIATIIGERFDAELDPVSLYKRIAGLLRDHGVPYIEIINDAGDVRGTDSILKAGYLPCAYFPGLKSQGESRRDYVVFARSFENFSYPSLGSIGHVYIEYLQQYHRLEARAYNRAFE